MNPETFVTNLQLTRFENVFNPYSDRCEIHDLCDAPRRRAQLLLELLHKAAGREIEDLWIGRDLGHRGGRRTGLAFTDDTHFGLHVARFSVSAERATRGTLISERTASVIWSTLSRITASIFLWNVFPFHPHDPGEPFSNRTHVRHERKVGEALLAEVVSILKPRRLVAIGNDARTAAGRVAGSQTVVRLRHPSYGGQREFLDQVRVLYQLAAPSQQLPLTLDGTGVPSSAEEV